MQLSVEDAAIGIAPKDQQQIFEEFQQLEMGLNRRHEGTGVGLALAKRLVELHSGQVWVESEPGKGSCLHVSLPTEGTGRTMPREPIPTVSPSQPPPIREFEDRPRVMVVEDDPTATRLLCQYLERGGYRAEIVDIGSQAVVQARSTANGDNRRSHSRPRRAATCAAGAARPGSHRPGSSMRELKAGQATASTPAVALSSHAMREDRERALTAGCDGSIVPGATSSQQQRLQGCSRSSTERTAPTTGE